MKKSASRKKKADALEGEASFAVGKKLNVKDKTNHWRLGQVIDTNHGKVLIHFPGWSPEWNEWVSNTDYLAPLKDDCAQDCDVIQPSCCLMRFSTTSQQINGPKTWNQTLQMPSLSENVANEIKHRESDLAHFQTLIDGLIARVQDASDDAEKVGVDLVAFLAQKGKHIRDIAALKAKQHFTVTDQNKFTAQQAGLYRIVIRVNGTARAANIDGLSIVVNGNVVARALAGLSTGHQIAVHLHELVPMAVGASFQINQVFKSGSLLTSLDNSLFVEAVNHRVCRYTANTQQTGAVVKSWTIVQQDNSLMTCSSGTQFVATQAGLYRVVVKVHGASSAANIDHIAIQLAGVTVHRSMAGLSTGHQIATHLHEIISLTAGEGFQVYQCFNSGNLATEMDNTLFVEPVNPKMCRYTTTTAMATGYKAWQAVFEDPTWVTRSADGLKFTISQSGQYRVVVKINGCSSAANSDHIALYLNGTSIAKSMIGLSTGHQIASHLHEVLTLKRGDCLEVYQQFNGNSLADAMDNTLFFELLDNLEEEKKDFPLADDSPKCTLQQELYARSTPSCSRCCKSFSDEKTAPKSLGCCHLFCLICIDECATMEGFRCHLCSTISTEPPRVEPQVTSVAITARDYSRQVHVAETEIKETLPKPQIKCEQCEEAVATLRSEFLEAFLCDKCNKILNQNKVIVRKQDDVMKIEDWTFPVLCSAHNRRVKLFCHDDQELICRQCATSSAHKGHDVEDPLSAFNSVVIPNLDDLAMNANSQQTDVETLLGKLSESQEQLISSTTVFPQIKKYFKQVRAVLDQCEQNTLRSTEQHINQVQKDLCDARLGLLSSFANLSKVVDDFNNFREQKEPVTMKTAIEFFARVENCQAYKRCNFEQHLKVIWQPEPFDPPKYHLRLSNLQWEQNHQRLLDIKPAVAVVKATVAQTSAYKSWNQKEHINDEFFEFKDDACFVKKSGLYRVVVRVNGTTSNANSDHLALRIDQAVVARSYAGLNTGIQIAVHLHEVVSLKPDQKLQVYQQFNLGSLTALTDNFMYIEAITHNVCHYSTTAQSSGTQIWNSALQEDKLICTCTEQKTFTASEDGLYRVVVNINGSSTSANVDQIGIMVGGAIVQTAMVGLNTGHYIAAHLHELIPLKKGESFQIAQSFSGSNLANAVDNSLFVERADPKICRYRVTKPEGNGAKSWIVTFENKNWVTVSADGQTFTVASAGYYRIVIKVNGTSSGSNSDHISLSVDGTVIARSLIGLNTGHQFASHLHELVYLKPRQTFQVLQQFSNNSLGGTFNSLYVERI